MSDVVASVPLAALRGIWKVYDSVTVLRGIDFEILPGKVHALLGGNGSGKSTIVKILSGAIQPTAGAIEYEGQAIDISRPSNAHAHGIYMVPQEPHIFPNLSVLENLTTGLSGSAAANVGRAAVVSKEIGLNVDLAVACGALSIANQQLVEIARGLLRDAKILILDEPTSSLTRREVANLAHQMRQLTARGIGILFISHRLDEVLDLSDHIDVLRDGHFVLSAQSAGLNSEQLIQAMLPKDSAEPAAKATTTKRTESGEPVLAVHGLSGKMFQEISFQVFPGEVLGISGVVGSGRTELAEAIFGIDGDCTGEVTLAGQTVSNRTPQHCQQMGLSYVPENRHAHGIFLSLPCAYTVSSAVMSLAGSGYMSSGREIDLSQGFVDRMQIKLESVQQKAQTLSGGNQQKVVLAKTLATRPRVIILDEPTRGIDARARQDVYRIIRELSADGVGIVVISSEVPEICEVSDRVLVMARGRLRELTAERVSVEQVSAATFDARNGMPA